LLAAAAIFSSPTLEMSQWDTICPTYRDVGSLKFGLSGAVASWLRATGRGQHEYSRRNSGGWLDRCDRSARTDGVDWQSICRRTGDEVSGKEAEGTGKVAAVPEEEQRESSGGYA